MACRRHVGPGTKGRTQPLVYSPEGKHNEAADEKYCRKDEKQDVAGLLPPGIRKHLSRLKTDKEIVLRHSDISINFLNRTFIKGTLSGICFKTIGHMWLGRETTQDLWYGWLSQLDDGSTGSLFSLSGHNTMLKRDRWKYYPRPSAALQVSMPFVGASISYLHWTGRWAGLKRDWGMREVLAELGVLPMRQLLSGRWEATPGPCPGWNPVLSTWLSLLTLH